MVETTQNLSVNLLQTRQRRERFAWTAGLIAVAVVCAIALVLFNGPLPLAIGLAALVLVAAIFADPRLGLYLLFFCSILLEQWGIVGLNPVTAQYFFYQTLSGYTGFPLPVSPLELVLLLTLAALLLPHIARRGAPFVRGPLFVPILLFLGFVAASIAYGLVSGGGAGPFDIRAAWEETRAFFYLAITYVLACNLIRTRAQLYTFVWLFIAAVGLKSAQGIVRFIYVRSNGLQVEAITGHEDVVFFAAFVLLLAGLLLFGNRNGPYPGDIPNSRYSPFRILPEGNPVHSELDVPRRQLRVMLVILPPLVFTLLVTDRRLGFVVLGAGLTLVALLLLRTRRDIFFRLVPLVLAGAVIYVVLFWNGTGTLSEPIRAVRSLFAPDTARDLSSNTWRSLENLNIYYNLRIAPITGLGFGRPIYFIVSQPSLDATGFTYWRFISHNAIYWVWTKMGALGFILFWNLVGSAIVLGLVTFRQLRDGYLKAIALTAAGAALMQVIFSYGDLGLTYSRSMLFLGCMLGVLAGLAALAGDGRWVLGVRDESNTQHLTPITQDGAK